MLATIFVLAGGIWAFLGLAEEVGEGDTEQFDRAIVLALRNAADLSDPIGPRWFEEMVRDVTALGSFVFLGFLSGAVVGYLLLIRKRAAAAFAQSQAQLQQRTCPKMAEHRLVAVLVGAMGKHTVIQNGGIELGGHHERTADDEAVDQEHHAPLGRLEHGAGHHRDFKTAKGRQNVQRVGHRAVKGHRTFDHALFVQDALECQSGAGADAIPLARLVSEMGWVVTVYDHRPAYLTPGRFPTAHELNLLNRDEPPGMLPSDSLTAAVVMTHAYARDLEILPAVLRTEAFYVGLLGPKSRTTQLLNEIARNGWAPEPQKIERLYAPVGLDIGGHTPEGIALAIVAEIQGVLRSRCGGHLRERNGSIYGRS